MDETSEILHLLELVRVYCPPQKAKDGDDERDNGGDDEDNGDAKVEDEEGRRNRSNVSSNSHSSNGIRGAGMRSKGKHTPPTWNMFDFFADLFTGMMMRLEGMRSSDLIHFHQCFQKFREIASSHFFTSSEEKGTLDEYHSKIFQREAKARKDISSLQHQLQVQREKRAKAFAQYQSAEKRLHKEEELIKEEALEAEHQLEVEFNTLEQHESKNFNEEESSLLSKCTELRLHRQQLQIENREAELSLRDKKEQSVEEVTNLLKEYADDIKARKEDLLKLQEDHKNIQMKIDKYQNYFKEKELEEVRKKEEERITKMAKLARKKKRIDSIYFIQYAWRRFKRRKEAKIALETKDKNKKGKQPGTKSQTKPQVETPSKKAPGKKGKKK